MHSAVRPRAFIRAPRVAALAWLLVFAVSTAHAAPRTSAMPDGFGKVLSYFSCAWAVAMAVEPTSWVAATANCLRTLYDELNDDDRP